EPLLLRAQRGNTFEHDTDLIDLDNPTVMPTTTRRTTLPPRPNTARQRRDLDAPPRDPSPRPPLTPSPWPPTCTPPPVRAIPLLLLASAAAFAADADVRDYTTIPAIHRGTAVLWQDPGAVERLDLRFGSGGRAHQPRPPFTFLKE